MKRIYILLIPLLMISSFLALDNNSFNTSNKSLYFSKNNDISNLFDSNLSYKINDSNYEDIKLLSKKVTYLLFGKENESNEDYYRRHNDYLSLRYNPKIPKDENGQFDITSEEYKDDILSGISIPSMFNMVNEQEITINDYGNIKVGKSNDMVISEVSLINVKRKVESDNGDYIIKDNDNLTMYYYFKKIDDEYKLYYLYGIFGNEMEEYFDNNDDIVNSSKSLSILPIYTSNLSEVYNFKNADSINKDELNKIYDKTKKSLVSLNAYTADSLVSTSTGVCINDNMVASTWYFLERSLKDAQFISISQGKKNYKIEGIAKIDINSDLVIFKLNDKCNNIKLENELPNIEDAVIYLNNDGLKDIIKKGIILSNDNYLDSSIPISNNETGTLALTKKGKLLGLVNSNSINKSTSNITSFNIIEDIISSIDESKILSFDDIKENFFYTKYEKEKVIDNIENDIKNEYKIDEITKRIKLDLVKSNYKNNVVSLRYKNSISSLINTMDLSIELQNYLKENNYNLENSSKSKIIYSNEKENIYIMEEMDYLIVLVVKKR